LAYFGFSKPQAVENISIVLNRFGDNFSQFEGKSTAAVLAGSAKTSVAISPDYAAGKMDHMLIENIVRIPGLIAKYQIAAATPVETLVGYFPVNPSFEGTFDVTDSFEVTPLSGVSRCFTWWCGDLSFDLEVIASVFHRTTLLVCWDPIVGSAPSFADALQTLQNTTISVSGYSKTRIDIPWKQPTNYLPAVANNDTVGSNGRVYIFVVNPLTSNGSTDSIAVNVYSYSDNIGFFAPETSLLAGLTPLTRSILTMNDAVTVEVKFGGRTDLSKSAFRAFGEEYHTIKQLTSKLVAQYVDVISVPVAPAVPANAAIVVRVPTFPIWDTNFEYTQNFSSWFALAFLGYRGGMRYTFHAADSPNSVLRDHMYAHASVDRYPSAASLSFVPAGRFAVAANDFAFTVGNRAVCPTMDVVVPAQHPWDYSCSRTQKGAWYGSVAMVNNIGPNTTSNPIDINVTLCSATADDGSFCNFLGFPIISKTRG